MMIAARHLRDADSVYCPISGIALPVSGAGVWDYTTWAMLRFGPDHLAANQADVFLPEGIANALNVGLSTYDTRLGYRIFRYETLLEVVR